MRGPLQNLDADLCGDRKVIASIVGISTLYATVRYNVFKGVPWSDWPHVIGNKILAIASLLLIATAVWRLRQRRQPIRNLMGLGSALAVAHSLLSVALLDPIYFEKFYVAAKLSLPAGASLLAGSVAMALLLSGKGRPGSLAPRASGPELGLIAFLSGCHAALPSTAGWFDPFNWPGGMPPITLISFLVGTITLLGSRWISASPTSSSDNEAGEYRPR